MRILFPLHQYLPHHCAGTEVYTHSLARALNPDHEVLVFCHEAAMDGGTRTRLRDEYDGIPVHRVPAWLDGRSPTPWQAFSLSYRNRLIEQELDRVLTSYRPDIVHVQHLKDVSAGCLGVVAKHGVPMLMTLHDYWSICPNAQRVRPDHTICQRTHARLECGLCAADRLGRPGLRFAAPLMMPLFWERQRFVRRQLCQVDRFVSPSYFLRDRYAEAGLDGERITVLENGLDTSRIAAATQQEKPPYRGHYAFIGSLAWQKGVHILLQAAHSLSELDIQVRIWGDLHTFPAYVHELISLAKAPNVALCGAIPQARVGEALAWADYLITPSLWWENSPVTIQEAFAAGVPVIGSSLGAIPEKVRDGETGLLFAPGDASELAGVIRRTYQEPDLRDRLRAHLPPVMSIGEHVERIMAIYEELCHGS